MHIGVPLETPIKKHGFLRFLRHRKEFNQLHTDSKKVRKESKLIFYRLGGVLIQASHMTADTRDNIDW